MTSKNCSISFQIYFLSVKAYLLSYGWECISKLLNQKYLFLLCGRLKSSSFQRRVGLYLGMKILNLKLIGRMAVPQAVSCKDQLTKMGSTSIAIADGNNPYHVPTAWQLSDVLLQLKSIIAFIQLGSRDHLETANRKYLNLTLWSSSLTEKLKASVSEVEN